MADWRATSDWTARMRETPNLARNTVFVEEPAPKPQTQQPYRGGRPGAPPSGIRDGDWQCPECPWLNATTQLKGLTPREVRNGQSAQSQKMRTHINSRHREKKYEKGFCLNVNTPVHERLLRRFFGIARCGTARLVSLIR